MYYVRTRFFTNGKTEGKIFLESEDKGNTFGIENEQYEEYWDICNMFEDAEKLLADLSIC